MTTLPSLLRKLALVAAGAACAGSAMAASASAEAQARYRQEMAVCNSGQSNQDAATCRTEARNALAEARRGGLTAAPPDQYQSNAMQRCSVFKGADLSDCEARMRSDASVQGSAAAGGVLREGVRMVPAQ